MQRDSFPGIEPKRHRKGEIEGTKSAVGLTINGEFLYNML